jgi:hypothetical protein
LTQIKIIKSFAGMRVVKTVAMYEFKFGWVQKRIYEIQILMEISAPLLLSSIKRIHQKINHFLLVNRPKEPFV